MFEVTGVGDADQDWMVDRGLRGDILIPIKSRRERRSLIFGNPGWRRMRRSFGNFGREWSL
jgi:hypothetical protein